MKFTEIRCSENRVHSAGNDVYESCGSFMCAVESGKSVTLYARCPICGSISLIEFDGVFAIITKQNTKQDFDRAWRIKHE
jgi:hypothetical protein